MKKYPMKGMIVYKQSVKGATLIEVLVSVFLLTFGILGLMAAQLNSVAAVSESENRAIAAQAAENLAEAMQANPDLGTGGKKDYSKYLTTNLINVKTIESCIEKSTTSAAPTTLGAVASGSEKKACKVNGAGTITKTELAQIQLDEFQFVLSQMPNTVDLKYTICLDDVASLQTKATANDLLTNANCAGTGGQPVIKVVWSSIGSAKETTTGVPATNAQLYYLVLPQ